ncbi:MAG: 5'-methylthioadenosine/adenosylhomocysteine nucleosidase [Eubacterium sp.]|nr:5'-methylthioadenosine/adenosylhomocysteine nucleosidase [Eubacterium sp.]
MIGIIAALDGEVQDIKKEMVSEEILEYAGMRFYKGLLFGKPAVAVRCGVGKVNAGICTQVLVDRFGVEAVINVGIAGGLAKGLRVGDLVIGKDAVQYDMDASAFGHPVGEIPNMDITYFPADERLVNLAKNAASGLGAIALVGRILTADKGVGSTALKEQLRADFDGACVEMEGAAIAQAAYINKIPYCVIRSISDNADDSAAETYEENFAQSMKNAAAMVLEMIKNY